MNKSFIRIQLLLYCFFFLTAGSFSRTEDSSPCKILSRLSFYSYEKNGEVLLTVPSRLISTSISANLYMNGELCGSWSGVPGKNIIRIPITLGFKPSSYTLTATISDGRMKFTATSDLRVLECKSNEVKIDRLTGGLIVNRRQFFPFGFYCYSPVYKTLPEEEAVRGFNFMSPYQKILPGTFAERKAYMDRCAQLGMKVHYNILSVSGGGGVNSRIDGLTDKRKRELLTNEIMAFRDHPALLAWYIADEPTGNKIEPDSLEKIYNLVRELDPWHPVSVVFMAPFLSSLKYAGALDIVMADPYPVPDIPLSLVGNVAGQLCQKFDNEKPVWIAVQAFGGGEIWKREPTSQELRSMTYQAIINGATGIQYFVRQGLNLFPKSVPAWNECGRMAAEVAEMTPWLLSDEPGRMITTGSADVLARSFNHEGKLLILAVNKSNAPARVSFKSVQSSSGKADLIFENRYITVSGGYFSDILSAYGSQAYIIDQKLPTESIKLWSGNLLQDPGFEDNSSPGVPSACYARGNGERGATYFTDTREHCEGTHSLRLVTPVENGFARIRFYPVRIRPGASYFVSVWAKTDPEQGVTPEKKFFEISFGDFGSERFTPDRDWQQYTAIFTVPYNTDLPPKANLVLQMPSAGVGWFDMVQVAECSDIGNSIYPEIKFNGIH